MVMTMDFHRVKLVSATGVRRNVLKSSKATYYVRDISFVNEDNEIITITLYSDKRLALAIQGREEGEKDKGRYDKHSQYHEAQV